MLLISFFAPTRVQPRYLILRVRAHSFSPNRDNAVSTFFFQQTAQPRVSPSPLLCISRNFALDPDLGSFSAFSRERLPSQMTGGPNLECGTVIRITGFHWPMLLMAIFSIARGLPVFVFVGTYLRPFHAET